MYAAPVILYGLAAILLAGIPVMIRGRKLRKAAQARGEEEYFGDNNWDHAAFCIFLSLGLFAWLPLILSIGPIQERDDPDDWVTSLDWSEHAALADIVMRVTHHDYYEATEMPAGKHEDMLSLIPACRKVALESAQLTFHEVSEARTADGANGELLEPWRDVLAVSYEQPIDRFWIGTWYWPDLHEREHSLRREFAEVLLNAAGAQQAWDFMDSRHPVSHLTDAEQFELYTLLEAAIWRVHNDPVAAFPTNNEYARRRYHSDLAMLTDWCIQNWEWVNANEDATAAVRPHGTQ